MKEREKGSHSQYLLLFHPSNRSLCPPSSPGNAHSVLLSLRTIILTFPALSSGTQSHVDY